MCDCFLQFLPTASNKKCYRLLSIIIDCSLISIIIDQDWILYISTYYRGCDTTHCCLLGRRKQQAPSKRQHYVQDYTASRSHCRPVTIHTTSFPVYQSHQRFNWLLCVSSNALPQPAVSVSTTQEAICTVQINSKTFSIRSCIPWELAAHKSYWNPNGKICILALRPHRLKYNICYKKGHRCMMDDEVHPRLPPPPTPPPQDVFHPVS